MSKRWDEERWGPHMHCKVCGNAMPEGKTVCSPECQTKYDKEVSNYKRSQKMNYVILALMGASILVFFLVINYFPA